MHRNDSHHMPKNEWDTLSRGRPRQKNQSRSGHIPWNEWKCHARLKLYSYLHQLQHQVLYYDTDSVIYLWKEDLLRIETGDYLGEMKNEVEGDYIVEFVP